MEQMPHGSFKIFLTLLYLLSVEKEMGFCFPGMML